jgi:soluble lytic murein transglycosylase-like protein
MPVLNAAEVKYGIPQNLLARVAFQESSFRRSVIDGTTKSDAGAVGIMQLLPQFFPDAGVDPAADIDTAARYLANLQRVFQGDWQLALAAYNWGPSNVQKCLSNQSTLSAMPTETQHYVTEICADVPVGGVLVT